MCLLPSELPDEPDPEESFLGSSGASMVVDVVSSCFSTDGRPSASSVKRTARGGGSTSIGRQVDAAPPPYSFMLPSRAVLVSYLGRYCFPPNSFLSKVVFSALAVQARHLVGSCLGGQSSVGLCEVSSASW